MQIYAVWFNVILLGILRAIGWKSPVFQAVAHLYAGGLIGAWLIDLELRAYQPFGVWSATQFRRRARFLIPVIAVSVVELVCFLVGALHR